MKKKTSCYTFLFFAYLYLTLSLLLCRFANMMSSVYIVDDQCCERIRTSLEVTDVEHDVQMFIDKYGTGTRVTGNNRKKK